MMWQPDRTLWTPGDPLDFRPRRDRRRLPRWREYGIYYPCCCEGLDCLCSGDLPDEWEVVLVVVQRPEKFCDYCTDLSDTYILTGPHQASPPAGRCYWRYEIDPAICGFSWLTLAVYTGGNGNIWIQVALWPVSPLVPNAGPVAYEDTGDTTFDCAAASSLAIDDQLSTGGWGVGCAFSSVTVSAQ